MAKARNLEAAKSRRKFCVAAEYVVAFRCNEVSRKAKEILSSANEISLAFYSERTLCRVFRKKSWNIFICCLVNSMSKFPCYHKPT
jgi:hypothetical protein